MREVRYLKRGHQLEAGDAIVLLGDVHVISSVEPTARGRIIRSATLQIPLTAKWSEQFELDATVPGPHDGYMSEVRPGEWEVSTEGMGLGVYTDEAAAATVLAQTSKRPQWKVSIDGKATRLG